MRPRTRAGLAATVLVAVLATSSRAGSAAPMVPPGLAAALLPAGFAVNAGQWPTPVRFGAVGGAALAMHDQGLNVGEARLTWLGSRPGARAMPDGPPTGRLNLLLGDDPRGWRTGIPIYPGLVVRQLYPGIDLHLAASGGALRAWLRVDDRADPSIVRWREGTEAAGAGEGLAAGHLRPHRDLSDASRAPGAAPGERSLAGAQPDAQGEIDLTLLWSTYLGGRQLESVRGIAVDAAGRAHLAGFTTSDDFPVVAPLQPQPGNSGRLEDAFVARLSPDGTALEWATYLGGSRRDIAEDVAVDAQGRVAVVGITASGDFPTARAVQPDLHLADGIFSGDAFVVRLAPDGASLDFGTFLGGTGRDHALGAAIAPDGGVVVAGWTGSHFPAVNAVWPLNRGIRDAFVARFTPDGGALAYSTHLGGSDRDEAWDVAVDDAGAAYVVGVTQSRNLRIQAPLQRAFGGGVDAFAARLAPDGAAFDYVTYLGDRGDDEAVGVAVHGREAVVTGRTTSTGFPREAALKATLGGPGDAFVTRFSAAGDALIFSTYLGGRGDENHCRAVDPFADPSLPRVYPERIAGAVALAPDGDAWLTGCTASADFPLARALDATRTGDVDAFGALLSAGGDTLRFGTYLGGRGGEAGRAAAADGAGALYVAGDTDATDFPVARPLQGERRGTTDGFALKLGPPPSPSPPPSATMQSTTPAPTSTPTATRTPRPSPSATAVEPTPTLDRPTGTLPVVTVRVFLPSADAGGQVP